MPTTTSLPRLVYLAAELKPAVSKRLLKYVPQGTILGAIAAKGLQGARAELDLPHDQLQQLYILGKTTSKASLEEFYSILADVVISEVEMRREDLTQSEYLNIIGELNTVVSRASEQMVSVDELDMTDQSEAQDIPKFNSGFTPLDQVLQGFYQGIFLMMAHPGAGKTSVSGSLMEALRATNAAKSIWFYQLEIPAPLMKARMNKCRERVKFLKPPYDRLICGSKMMSDIMDEVKSDPEEDRVLIIDSPDVMAGGSGEGKRFVIESIYKDLVQLKQVVKAIFVTSWPRRKDQIITLNSPADSVDKIRYADAAFGWTRLGQLDNGMTQVRVNVVKNRFGPMDADLTFAYNYKDLSWDASAAVADPEW